MGAPRRTVRRVPPRVPPPSAQVNGLPALSSALGEAPQVLAWAAVLHRAASDRAGALRGVGALEQLAQGPHGLRLALGEDLHPTVGQVAGEHDQAELERPGANHHRNPTPWTRPCTKIVARSMDADPTDPPADRFRDRSAVPDRSPARRAGVSSSCSSA